MTQLHSATGLPSGTSYIKRTRKQLEEQYDPAFLCLFDKVLPVATTHLDQYALRSIMSKFFYYPEAEKEKEHIKRSHEEEIVELNYLHKKEILFLTSQLVEARKDYLSATENTP